MNDEVITDVCCAIIEHKGRVLAAQRAKCTSNPGKWEFPGGKKEPAETYQECIIREIKEELSITVSVIMGLEPVVHNYTDKTIRLHPFICGFNGDDLELKEHQQARWFLPSEMGPLDWSAADMKVLKKYMGLSDYRKAP